MIKTSIVRIDKYVTIEPSQAYFWLSQECYSRNTNKTALAIVKFQLSSSTSLFRIQRSAWAHNLLPLHRNYYYHRCQFNISVVFISFTLLVTNNHHRNVQTHRFKSFFKNCSMILSTTRFTNRLSSSFGWFVMSQKALHMSVKYVLCHLSLHHTNVVLLHCSVSLCALHQPPSIVCRQRFKLNWCLNGGNNRFNIFS